MCLYSIRYQCTSEIGENDLSISRTLTLSPAYYIGFINNLNILFHLYFCYTYTFVIINVSDIFTLYHCKSVLSLWLKVNHSLSNGRGLIITFHPFLLLYKVNIFSKIIGPSGNKLQDYVPLVNLMRTYDYELCHQSQ